MIKQVYGGICSPNNSEEKQLTEELFSPKTDYTPAVRLALNADVEPAVEIKAIWYDKMDETFLVHLIDPADGMMYEEVLQSTFVFSCFRAVNRGIIKWTNTDG